MALRNDDVYAAQALCEKLDQTVMTFPGSRLADAFCHACATSYWGCLPRFARGAQHCHSHRPVTQIGARNRKFLRYPMSGAL